MNLFLKAVSYIFVVIVIQLVLSRQGKEYGLLVIMLASVLVLLAALQYLDPVLSFFQKLERVGNIEPQMLKILLKSVGIGLLAEIVGLICVDTGNSALGKGLQMLASGVILWLSIPLLEELLTLLETILGAI